MSCYHVFIMISYHGNLSNSGGGQYGAMFASVDKKAKIKFYGYEVDGNVADILVENGLR